MSLCIIDGYNFVFRAFYAMPPLMTKDNIPVGAVYGFINMLNKVIKNHNFTMLVVALDHGKYTFRHQIYGKYKDNRKDTDKSLIQQFPIIREAIKAFGIQFVEIPNFEADDIIASYVKLATSKNLKVKIVSSDKDMIQLLAPGIEIFDYFKNAYVDQNYVLNKFGVTPKQMTDFFAMVGDVSDNIPGIKSIGPKTAAKLLKRFHDLDEIYSNIDQITSPRIAKIIMSSKDIAYISKQLVTLQSTGFNLPYSLSDLQYHSYNYKTLEKFYIKYGFHSLYHALNQSLDNNIDLMPNTKINVNQLDDIKNSIVEYGEIFIHIDDKHFSCFFKTELYSIAINENFFLSIHEFLKSLVKKHKVKLIVFSIQKFCRYFPNIDVKLYEDISLLFYTLRTGNKFSCIEDIARVLNIELNNRIDAYTVYTISKILLSQIISEKILYLYEDIEKPLAYILLQMERKGMLVCKNQLNTLNQELIQKRHCLEEYIYLLAGEKFNISSSKQTGSIIFDKLGLISSYQSQKKNMYATNAEILRDLAYCQGIIIAKYILEWRHLSKLITTYTNVLPNKISDDGRIHTTFYMTSTITSRLSSQNPNLQNIPIRGEYGKYIRKSFIASQGCTMIIADYSQIELRILAHIADIKHFKKAFKQNEDIHTITASEIFQVPIDEVSYILRNKAKLINFGIIYGISAHKLSNNLGIAKDIAQNYIDTYFSKYPEIRNYISDTISYAEKFGYIKTIMGRKCFIDQINSTNFHVKSFAQRTAVNARIQGSASEIIKSSMVKLDSNLREYLIMQVHDELIFEIPNDYINFATKTIKKIMESTVSLDIPLLTHISISNSWSKINT